ncbi:hypothetical protein SLEP1_g45749 [Rubroshorea leprosula]|uniref:Uncharacterized protein n=1 Tax=Rubroshorea leprosula TaxID=152421 RepID=A0AAV5LK45_9ROSI|nr:hypothetical protein SLEP1_g45749 [Rubroshorea leprosula]
MLESFSWYAAGNCRDLLNLDVIPTKKKFRRGTILVSFSLQIIDTLARLGQQWRAYMHRVKYWGQQLLN